MTGAPPLIRIAAVLKTYEAEQPLRIADLSIGARDRVVLSGFDQGAAAMFVYLVTGAALPDEGQVHVAGRDTREIATDTEWLTSLDRFGIVTHRAVLLEGLSVAANLALPLTLSIDPIADDVRERIAGDAREAGLALDRLEGPVSTLSDEDRLRLHLARAAAVRPELIMLEHPTQRLDQKGQSAAFGDTLKRFSANRGFGWIAISDDEVFAKATGGRRLRLEPESGRIRAARWWGRILG